MVSRDRYVMVCPIGTPILHETRFLKGRSFEKSYLIYIYYVYNIVPTYIDCSIGNNS